MTDSADMERTRVQTYVPAYQKSIWADHAEELGMTQSEFVRTMVQAGRRGFLSGPSRPSASDSADPSSGANPRGTDTEEVVVELLSREGPLDWDELVERLSEEIEDRLDDALGSLQSENRIRYSGRDGGYVLDE